VRIGAPADAHGGSERLPSSSSPLVLVRPRFRRNWGAGSGPLLSRKPVRIKPYPLQNCGPLRPKSSPSLRKVMLCSVVGGADGKPNREIRVSGLRRPSRRRSDYHHSLQLRARGRRLPNRTRERIAARPALVLPQRARNQAPLLVSARRRRKGRATSIIRRHRRCFAKKRNSGEEFDRRRARRTTVPPGAGTTRRRCFRRAAGASQHADRSSSESRCKRESC
jgi:hypothetical protein